MQDMTFAKLYQRILEKLVYGPDCFATPRGKEISELTNRTYCLVNPRSNMFSNPARDSQKILTYLATELRWYFLKCQTPELIRTASNFWGQLLNPDGTVNSNYGRLLFDQSILPEYSDNISDPDRCYSSWQWAWWSLKNDKETRQAVIHFCRPHHLWEGNKDIPCTMSGQFLIRDHALNLSINMRSQDIIRGLQYDLPFFSMILQLMQLHLEDYYPELVLGNLTLFVGSEHLYNSDLELAKKMLDNEFQPMELPLMQEPLNDISGDPHPLLISGNETTDKLINFINLYSVKVKPIGKEGENAAKTSDN